MRLPLLSALLLLTACTRPDAGPSPVDLDRLAPAVADLHLAEALSIEVPVQVRDSVTAVYFDRVLADHGLTRTAFDSLSGIVRREPEWVDSLYARVGVILAETEAGRRADE